MPMANRVLVYQRYGGDWEQALAQYKADGWIWGVNLYTRKERCYKGPESCAKVWTESEQIAKDYHDIGVENDVAI